MTTYTNTATGEIYKLSGINSLEHAWNLAGFVCRRNNWNLSTFCSDVRVKFQA